MISRLGVFFLLCWASADSASVAKSFAKLSAYPGNLSISGSVAITQNGTAQSLTVNLQGTDPKCNSTPNTVKNGCGIHVHSGANCSVAGGHLYNTTLFNTTTDPWLPVKYATAAGGASMTAMVETGLAGVDGQVVIVHDAKGAKVACSTLVTQADPTVGGGGMLSSVPAASSLAVLVAGLGLALFL